MRYQISYWGQSIFESFTSAIVCLRFRLEHHGEAKFLSNRGQLFGGVVGQLAVVGHWDVKFRQMLLLIELVLDRPDCLPRRLNLDLRGDFLEGVGIDMLYLCRQDVASLCQPPH